MSGHSKWSTIKRQKGVQDQKRGQIFTKLSMAITLAVKQGGNIPGPEKNFKLRLAIDAAKASNMPKENIERAIQRAGSKQEDVLEEVVYEGFGPGGVSIIVEAVTDNRKRTAPEIRSLFEKNGGTIGNAGSVAYQFVQKGLIRMHKNTTSFDNVLLLAADAGAEDVLVAGDEFHIYTKNDELSNVKNILSEKGLEIGSAELTREPLVTMAVTEKETLSKLLAFLEKLENHNDVQKVYANYETPEEWLEGATNNL